MQTDSVENVFSRAWSLLAKNPVIVVPGVIVGLVVGLVQAAIMPHPDLSDPNVALAAAGRTVIAGLVTAAIGVVAFLINQTYTVGMAGAAWQRGTTTLADGAAAFKEDASRLFFAMLLLAAIGIIVALLTFGLGWFIVLFFAIYMIPAVVLDNQRPVPALQTSFNIATKRVLPTILIVLLLFAIGIGVGLIVLPLAFIPFIGPIVAGVVSQAVAAYATLVIVGEYLSARTATDIHSAGPTAGPIV